MQGANITSFADAVWWGIVTLLTVGYGDRFPVTDIGRIAAGVLMFAGVIGMSLITAKISAYYFEKVLKEGKGIVDPTSLNDHLIVCGYKDDIDMLLMHILEFNEDMDASQIVLIGHFSDEIVQGLRATPELKSIQIIFGDYTQEAFLNQARPDKARKILILADRAPLPNGQIPSVKEVDARTLMAAMTLSKIARETLVSAEILDPKMEPYMKMAHVSEIIYSREYNRLLLANVSSSHGIAHVLFDLLDPQTPTILTSRDIDEAFVGKKYLEFKLDYEKRYPNVMVLGVLENTGNRHKVKELALKEAQKTANMEQLVHNLKAVKKMELNSPLFSPGADYVVKSGSSVIILETRTDEDGPSKSPVEVNV